MLVPASAGAVPSDASTANQETEANGLTVTVEGPDEDNDDDRDGRLFCTLYDSGTCEPINRSSCSGGDTRRLDLVLSYDGDLDSNSRMYVFLTTGDCTFSENQDPDEATLASDDLNSSDPLVNGQSFDFPADFSGDDIYSSVQGIIDALDACGEDGIQDQRYRLCIAISPSDGDVSDSAVESDDPYVYLTMLIDTVEPEAPSELSLDIGDGRFRGNVVTDDDDIYELIIRYRIAENQAEDAVVDDCANWSTYDEVSVRQAGDAGDDTSFTVDDLDNGFIYDVCANARDIAGNRGAFTAVQRVRTRDECDFIECYPGESPTGYCGANGGSSVWVLGLAAWLLFRTAKHSRTLIASGGRRETAQRRIS